MKLQILVGAIASGKSTYSKNAAKQGMICLNDDAIVNMLHADEYTLYNESLKIIYKSIENHVIGMGLAAGKAVLVDRGLNGSIQGRKRWMALASSFDVPCEVILFDRASPEEHAQRRAKHDARGHDYDYWLMVAKIHQSAYQEPLLSEGFSAIHRISWDDIQSGKVFG